MSLPMPTAIDACSHTLHRWLESHPASSFFAIQASYLPGVSAVLDVAIQQGLSYSPSLLKSVLPCLIDCAAQLACPESLGERDISELEISHLRTWRGEPLHLTVSIEVAQHRCAVFSAQFSLAHDATEITSAQGTLSSRFSDDG
ncbi:hypothetical protein [Gilvimarinus sp. DA14]|uniref:hypothetical protein n=1 Tax=Gilvimarinus sp. DA14 TaxID=2956798 RepID=UPI0020B705CD|nr:hypothetical protein [Gilvimarinus sp. DA14]UTF59255.1 hypothetical protein NHM04_12300 [Gilvimarinus sp. DA14]